MTDSNYDSPCHPDTTLYRDRYGYLICACGRAYHDPDYNITVNGKRSA